MAQAVHIPLAAQPVMPWANGRGATRQIAIEPPGSSLATGFRWRVSTAQVASDGPFSCLPGTDRSLWLLHGNGLQLDIDGRAVRLDRPLQRLDFAGEARVVARLLDGPIQDLNVMVARNEVRADVELREWEQGAVISIRPAPQCLLLVLEGSIATTDGVVACGGEAMRCDGCEPFSLLGEKVGRMLVLGFVGRGAPPGIVGMPM
jgi:environmental stress-induced protein Ves